MRVKALKKVLAIIMIALVGIIFLSTLSTVKAAISTTPKYLTIRQLRSTRYGYRALGKNIWKIVEATSDSNEAPVSYNNTIYCLKAGPGFGSSEFGNGAPTVRPYTRYFDMTDSDFINSNDIYRKVLPTDSTTYSALLWILEHAYVPGNDAATEYRETLLNAAGLSVTDLTDDDIDVVQQLAIWHFTNTGSSYDVEMDGSDTFELYVTLDPGIDEDYNYIALSAEEYWGDEGYYRALDAITLYNYLVDTALAEAEKGYVPTTNTGYTLTKNLESTLQESGNNYIVGPFKIEGTKNSNVTLNGTFTNGSGSPINVIRYQNADGTTTYNSLEDTIGNEFYIVVSNTTNIDTVTLTINGGYFNTEVTYWSVEGADTAEQPVAIVERTKETYEDSVTYTRPPRKIFDLALRKFIESITSADGQTVISPENRVPQITLDTINSLVNGDITTLEKTHSKDPIQVKPGDRVVYTIRIYNEGTVDGYATEITDYLPDGLRFIADSQINIDNGWSNPSNDGKTIITTALADNLLNGVEGTNVRYIDVQIECEVVADYGNTETSLKNVAEITKATDKEGKEVPDEIQDIDSTPGNLTEEQIENYNPTPYPDKSESGEGYEDDDDYEELILPSAIGDFELKLIKVNGLGNKLSGATFKVEELNSQGDVINTYEGLTTDETGEVVTERIAISGVGTRVFIITEEDAPDGYELLGEPIRLEVTVELINGVYTVTNVSATRPEEVINESNLQGENFNAAETLTTTINLETNNLNVEETAQSVSIENGAVKSLEVNDNTIEITIENSYFDLALRKFITQINGAPVEPSREPQVNSSDSGNNLQGLYNRTITTVEKTHTKTPLQVNTGDSVIYTIRVYNEGEIAGYATEITDYLPNGLALKENSTINTQYGWVAGENGEVTTDITSPNTTNPNRDTIYADRKAGDDKVIIDAFDGSNLDYIDVQIECEVVATKGETNTSLKNVAEITGDLDKDKEEVEDRDSTPDNLEEEQKNNYNPGESEKGWGYEDDDDYEELVLPAAIGEFDIKIIKENALGNKLQNAVFKVEEIGESNEVLNTYDNLTTNEVGEVVTPKIGLTSVGSHRYRITETTAPTGYELLAEPIVIQVNVTLNNGNYVASVEHISGEVKNIGANGNTIEVTIENSYFDLALRKFVTSINGAPVEPSREPQVNSSDSGNNLQGLYNRTITTVEKTHTKTPLQVNTGDSVIYTIRVYNEGEIAGYATEITDYLPNGLALKKNSTINTQYGWVAGENGEVTTDITSPNTTNPNRDTIYADRKEGDDKVIIDAFDGSNLDYIDVQIECEVVATKGETNTSLKNVAEITGDLDKDKEEVEDRDSTPDNLEEEQKNNYNPGESEKGWGYEDDDDYEELVLPGATGDFKIKLIKVNGLGNRLQDAVFKVEEVNTEGTVINTYDDLRTNGSGEILIDNLTIGGEGTRRFVISEKAAPEGYTLLEGSITIDVQITLENGEYKITANQVTNDTAVDTQQLGNLEEDATKEVERLASVKESTNEKIERLASVKESTNEKIERLASVKESTNKEVIEQTESNAKKLKNESTILERTQLINKITRETKDSVVRTTNLTQTLYGAPEGVEEETASNTSENGNVNSEDNNVNSQDDNVNSVDDTNESNGAVKSIRVNGNTIEITIENSYFDLSLRKFITGVNEEEITGRVPVFSIVDGEYIYTHPKDPVEVANGDIVIYTIRVYNEGEIAGYAEEVKDNLPEGLEFLPTNTTNINYRWVMYDANGNVTENVEEAVSIRTDYLSKAQEEETGRDNLIEGFNPDTMSQPDYKDLQIAFRVTEPNTSDRVLINTAEVSEDSNEDGDPVEDIDSTPDNDVEEEDDQDIEKVKVTYFDLSLKKIISEVTMTLDGKTTVEETGHTFEDNPEEVVKIELGNHKIQTSILKFTYRIRITNEGNKAGYAYEIKDYISEGLEFLAEDNNEHWTLSEDGKTVTSDELAETLLEPGESAEVEITLRWINGQTNLGVKTNWAEISEDSDDDIDSTPDNFEKGEDDIDDAEVVLSIVTGIGEHYMGVIAGTLAILATGLVLIKKYVL